MEIKRVAILVSDKIDFEIKAMKRDKERCYIMIKGSIQEEDITIINIYAPILSPCLFNLYAEYIMRNIGLEETQAGIKISGRNINNLRYADDTTLMAESEEELKAS